MSKLRQVSPGFREKFVASMKVIGKCFAYSNLSNRPDPSNGLSSCRVSVLM